ncbi:MAG: hypothetical protein GC134_02655 [Proteobacteria bacterium]|nr:hypothetical protein [Pseudomonadota bacterium]
MRRMFDLPPARLLRNAAICGYVTLLLPALAAMVVFLQAGVPAVVYLKILTVPAMILLILTLFWQYRWHWGLAFVFAFVLFNIGFSLMHIDPDLQANGYAPMVYVFGAMFGLISALGLAFVWAYHKSAKFGKDLTEVK